jgi:signal transduction histidine kinase
MAIRRPLRARLQLAITVAVLVFGSLNLLLVGRIAYQALRAEQDRRLSFVARLLAQRAARPLLTGDRLALQKLLEESRALDPDLAYVLVFNARGARVAESASESARGWLASSPEGPGGAIAYREAVERILDGKGGEVRVGIEENTLRPVLIRILQVISLMVLAFLITGVFAAVILARTITRPVERLVAFASNVRLEGKLAPLQIESEDEIAELAQHLQEVASRLQRLHGEARAREREMARVEHLATVGMLAAGVAHEINNPLAGIRTAVERLLRHTRERDEAERYGAVLRDAIARIERAVRGTLTFARASDVRLAPTRLSEVVERALGLAGPRLEEKRVSLVQAVPADLPTVRADPSQLVQIVLNLILNACDAVAPAGELSLLGHAADGFVMLEVRDDGPGVPVELGEKIFNPFFTTKPVGEGTGLGLAVSRAGVREMGGDLLLATPNGPGACFTIRLPVMTEEEPLGAHPAG